MRAGDAAEANGATNAFTACNELAYALRYRLTVPGLAAMGAAFPLGGTSNHFRTDILRRLGGWDVPRLAGTVRRGLGAIRSEPWFRRYAVAQLLFVPITLGATFYALHIPVESVDARGALPAVVASASVGLLIGSYLWRAVHRIAGMRGMLVGASLMAVTAAAVCMLVHAAGVWSQVWVHGLILLLAAAADQAIYAAAIEWIGMFAEEYDRPVLVGFSMAAVSPAASLAGGGAGRDRPGHRGRVACGDFIGAQRFCRGGGPARGGNARAVTAGGPSGMPAGPALSASRA
ncbi:glycosyltransferase family protein [Mycobacterium sp. HUMS_1102779]|uniref:hypothetical protein n=1 Tax=Mycobacterium sp. HUMS_1102779 TaxID=3383487 RepID=UPI003899E017